MQPYYSENGIEIYHGDNRDIMPSLGLVDHIITDPPYGERTHAGARTGGNGHSDPSSGKAVLVDFASITDDEFLAFSHTAVKIARRWVANDL